MSDFDMPPLTAGFDARGAWLIRNLMVEFDLTDMQAAGIVGNIGFESAGLEKLREIGQPEGKGGYGWGQWTATRREAFLNWCLEHELAWKSDPANWGYLLEELHNSQNKSIEQVKKTSTLEAAVFTFGYHFERPGGTTLSYLPGDLGRRRYAQRALKALQAETVSKFDGSNLQEALTALGAITKIIQTELTKATLYQSKVDGDLGPDTYSAIKAWQSSS